jgi:hypothetical protein
MSDFPLIAACAGVGKSEEHCCLRWVGLSFERSPSERGGRQHLASHQVMASFQSPSHADSPTSLL